MANNAFKVKDSLILKPVDLTAITSPTEGQLATDETDGLLKQYNSTVEEWLPINTAAIPLIVDLGTETWANTTGSTCTVNLQREGQYLNVEGYIDMAGAFPDTELNVVIPSAYTIDTTWYQNVSTARPVIGSASLSDAGAPTFGTCLLVASTLIRIQANNVSGTYEAGSNLTSTIPFTWNASDFITFKARFKVAAFEQTTLNGLARQSELSYGRVGLNTAQSITTSTTVIQYSSAASNYKLFGAGFTWNNSTYRWEFTRPMRVKAYANITYSTATTNLQIIIRKNGLSQAIQFGPDQTDSSASVSDFVDVVSGDFIDVVCTVDSGSTTTSANVARSIFTIEEIPFTQTAVVQQNKVATIFETQPSGTPGGTSALNAYQDRTLNTVNDPYGLVTSLSSNTFVLAPGRYYIQASAPAFRVDRHKLVLTNAGGTVLKAGSSQFTNNSIDQTTSVSTLEHIIISDGINGYKIRHYTATNVATNGLGIDTSSGDPEIYAQVNITKIGE